MADSKTFSLAPVLTYVLLAWMSWWVGSILSGVGTVVHEEEVDVTGVLDEEGLVAGGHHVLGLLVATVSDLYRQNASVFAAGHYEIRHCGNGISTEGMGMLLLNRLRTRLSIPLGLRHDEGTHLKRSDWWRQKVLVPVQRVSVLSSVSFSCSSSNNRLDYRLVLCPSLSFSSLVVKFSFHPAAPFNPRVSSNPFQIPPSPILIKQP